MPLVGVDMSIPANSNVGTIPALDDADRWLGAPAAFVGRYIGDGGGVATPLTAAEVAYLHGKGRAILVIYNLATGASVAGGWPAGVQDAGAAIRAAQALGVPSATCLWGDVEYGWALHPQWVEAWVETILQAGYLPGIYGALATQQFADAFNAAEVADRGNVDRCRLWSASWVSTGTAAAAAPSWNPQRPGPNGPAPSVWQFTGSTFGGIVDEDEIAGTLADAGLWLPPSPSTPPAVAPSPPTSPVTPVGGDTALRAALQQVKAIVDAALQTQ